jgi:hypothetical protein
MENARLHEKPGLARVDRIIAAAGFVRVLAGAQRRRSAVSRAPYSPLPGGLQEHLRAHVIPAFAKRHRRQSCHGTNGRRFNGCIQRAIDMTTSPAAHCSHRCFVWQSRTRLESGWILT